LRLVMRSRAIQVAAFAAAAGLRGQYRGGASQGPAVRVTEWSTLVAPSNATAQLNPWSMVTYHPEYHAYGPMRVTASLLAATQLGAGWIRTDFRWRELLPDGIRVDSAALSWYRAFLGATSALGLKIVAVLSTPPDEVLRQPEGQKLRSWTRFVEL